jgi:hypothetical protein
MGTAGAAFNAYQFAGCEDSLVINGERVRISRKVARRILPQLSVREHEGHLFAAEMKADEQ